MLALEVEGASIANLPLFCGSRLAGAASDKPGRLHRWQASSHNCTQALRQCPQYAHVGAGLPVLLQTNLGACIAGKPAPTTAHKPLANAPICPCGSRLAGDASDIPGRLHRWQASSHKCTQTMGQCTNMPMWEPACRRCFRQTRATASLASQLPQVHASPWPMHQYAPVAAGLPAMLQTNPGACIAGKPTPTSAHKPLANAPICPCGSRLAGDASDIPGRLHRWQASSYNCTQALRQCTNTPMWEPACRCCFRQTRVPASLASQLPQVHTSPWPMHQYAHVAAGLPAMLQTHRSACIAGKPAPTSAHKPWANTPRGSRLAGDGCPGCMLSLPASAQRGVYVHQ